VDAHTDVRSGRRFNVGRVLVLILRAEEEEIQRRSSACSQKRPALSPAHRKMRAPCSAGALEPGAKARYMEDAGRVIGCIENRYFYARHTVLATP
jgi:hypothetical protein